MMQRNNKNFYRDNKHSSKMFRGKDEISIKKKTSPIIDLNSEISFPSLRGSIQPNSFENTSGCYIKSVLTTPIDFTATILNELDIGWVSLSMPILGGVVVTKCNVKKNEECTNCHEEDNSSGVRIIEKLNENYEKWHSNFVKTWGEEEYMKEYTFLNHNINYFDEMEELDELQEIEDLEEKERNGYTSEGSY